MRITCGAWVLVAVVGLVHLHPALCAWTPATFPNPVDAAADQCGRHGVKSWICDPDHVLSVNSANVVEGILKDIAAGAEPYTRMSCGTQGLVGYQVAVAVMRKMELQDATSPAEAAAQFAHALHDKWGVGSAECNNGVLLFLSTEDRQVYISTGAGAHNLLTDDKVAAIIQAMRSKLREGDYDAAGEQAVVDIGLVLAGAEPHSDSHSIFSVPALMVVAFFSLFGWAAFSSWRRGREYRKCKNLLAKLKDEQQDALQNHKFFSSSCPVCLEDFSTETPRPAVPTQTGSVDQGMADEHPPASTKNTLSAETEPLVPPETTTKASDQTDHTCGRPLALPCGHLFCEACITQWFDSSHSTCPICRQSATGGTAPAPSCSGAVHHSPWSLDEHASEFDFRLRSAQRLYPTYISASMVDTWSSRVHQGSVFDWQASRDFQLHDAGMRSSHAHSGAFGASSSFGGGGSMGGGGSGGSW